MPQVRLGSQDPQGGVSSAPHSEEAFWGGMFQRGVWWKSRDNRVDCDGQDGKQAGEVRSCERCADGKGALAEQEGDEE